MTDQRDVFQWRLRSLDICNFRGLVGAHRLNVDADLVLLDGPNGYGKTSLLEGITLILTGWHPEAKDDLASLRSRRLDTGEKAARHEDGWIKAHRCLFEGGPPLPDDLELTLEGKPRRPDHLPPARFARSWEKSDWDRWALEARLMAFFQEQVRGRFDDMASGRTLSQLFDENPPEVTKTRDEHLPKAIARLEEALKALPSEPPHSEAHGEFHAMGKDFRDQYEKLREAHFPEWPAVAAPPEADPPSPYAEGLLDWLEEVAATWMRAQGDRQFGSPQQFLNAFDDALIAKARSYRRQADEWDQPQVERLQKVLDQCTTEIDAIGQQYPDLAQEIERFRHTVKDDAGRETVLDVGAALWFEVLAKKAADWGEVAIRALDGAGRPVEVNPLAEVLAQFRRIDTNLARQMAKTLRDWAEPRLTAWRKMGLLEEERQRLEREIEQARRSDALADLEKQRTAYRSLREGLESEWKRQRENREYLRDWDRIEARRERLQQARKNLDVLARLLGQAAGPNKPIRFALSQMTTRVMQRFSLVEGILPLGLESPQEGAWMPVTRDGRRIDDLSTGQKSQTAVALMAAQNLAAATDRLPPVLILDDVSTSYDLTNLTREALLWRQLAYGGTGRFRRQVFISSHHEDMTNNLIDLLTPPAGRTMRLLRFVGWSPDRGPEIEQYEVEPTLPTDGPDDTACRCLKETLCQLPI